MRRALRRAGTLLCRGLGIRRLAQCRQPPENDVPVHIGEHIHERLDALFNSAPAKRYSFIRSVGDSWANTSSENSRFSKAGTTPASRCKRAADTSPTPNDVSTISSSRLWKAVSDMISLCVSVCGLSPCCETNEACSRKDDLCAASSSAVGPAIVIGWGVGVSASGGPVDSDGRARADFFLRGRARADRFVLRDGVGVGGFFLLA